MGLFKFGRGKAPIPAADQQTSVVPAEEKQSDEVIRQRAKKELDDLTAPPWSQAPDVMVAHIVNICRQRDWWLTGHADGARSTVVVRAQQGYVSHDKGVDTGLVLDIAAHLNANICMLLQSDVLSEMIRTTPQGQETVGLSLDLIVQVWSGLADHKYCKRYQQLALIRQDNLLLAWGNDFEQLLPLILELERAAACRLQGKEDAHGPDSPEKVRDLESIEPEERPVQLLLPVMVFCTILINFLVIALAMRIIVYESLRSGSWFRFAFILYFPFLFFMTSFFSLMLVVSVINFVGPIGQLFQNSKFYSCDRPPRLKANLPHITVQCPVYKEDLADVIFPTVDSLQRAIATYERQGGSASIFVNDDGLQLLKPAERELRREFYSRNAIGWVARPGHGHNGFVRAGRFKKASNMNFAMDLANRVEKRLADCVRGEAWTGEDEARASQECLQQAIVEVKEQTGFDAWADGTTTMGDLILLIDSDTRVPLDCFLDAAGEFHWSPQVAIVQHQSGVMQVVHDFWENAITYFTRCIYFSLQWATASGGTAAFVGHNAFLRWSALQEIAVLDPTDGKLKYWSERHVSEDFEMSLKLQTKGYISRYATYSNEGFEEGVSLTCYDELLRWSKYAYGCSELVFNPFSKWHKLGPFTDIFRHFLKSDLNSFSKFTMVSYIGTYYAIASWPLLIVNYFVIGWYLYFSSQAYAFFNEGFGVFMSVLIVFNILGPISNAMSKYRAKWQGFWRATYENFKWSIPLVIFLGGLSMHLSYALIAHMCDLNIGWGATVKTLEQSDFATELPKIWQSFKYVYLTSFLLAALQVYFAYFARPLDRIAIITANLPLTWLLVMHCLMPLLLNSNSYGGEWRSSLWKPLVKRLRRLYYALKGDRPGYMTI